MANNITQKKCACCSRTIRSTFSLCRKCQPLSAEKVPEKKSRSSACERKCLCCGGSFFSAGIFNRVCRFCKSQRDWYDPAETGAINTSLGFF